MTSPHWPPRIRLTILSLTLFSVLVVAAEPTISNREPRPGELGYRPQDGSTVQLNPPSFIWLHEEAAHRYEVQWSRQPDFTPSHTESGLPFNTYTHSDTFSPGRYFWRYRFRDEGGSVSKWSRVRTVEVPATARAFPMPNRDQQSSRVPEGHPRLFLRPEDLPRLRAAAEGGAAEEFRVLREEADRLLAREPTPEPTQRGSARDKDDLEAIRYWWPNREQTLKACREAEVLALVYLITNEPRYGMAARDYILHLAGWDPDGPTNFRLNCEAAKPLLHRLPRAYDWAYAALTEIDRQTVRRVMRRRATDAWESWEAARGVGHFDRPYGSHANRTWHKLGECGLAFLREMPEAATWLDYAVNKFHACYPVWSDDDGGWHEGVSYWGGYLSKGVWWLQAAESALQIDGFVKPFFAQVVDYPMYVAPPQSPNMGFGDLSYRPIPSSWGGFVDYFVRMAGASSPESHAPYWRWWSEQWKMEPQTGILGFLYAAKLPAPPPAKAPRDLPPSKVFQGVGVASLHSDLLDSREDVHFLFKSSPFGTQSHGQNPHNSFQLNAYGEPLLTTCVYRDLHGSPFHYRYAHSTRAHNAVLVNEEGQTPHTPAPHGRIVASRLTPEWDYVVGEATAAYAGRLTRYQRHVLFLKPDVIVLWDDLEAREPATFQFMLHALEPFAIDPDASRLIVRRGNVTLTAYYLAPDPLRFRQWEGYEPQPRREFPNQWHVEASLFTPSRTASMLTVLQPTRGANARSLELQRLDSESAVGLALTQEGRQYMVAFRKPGVAGAVQVAGLTFDGPVAVDTNR